MQILNHELFDDLKCCGNCKKYLNAKLCEALNIDPSRFCKVWEYDNLKKVNRLIEK